MADPHHPLPGSPVPLPEGALVEWQLVQERPSLLAAVSAGTAYHRQPAPDGRRAAAPEPLGAGAAPRACDVAEAGPGAGAGGVVGGGSARRAQDARRRLLHSAGHARPQADLIQPQGPVLQSLQRPLATYAQALRPRVPQQTPPPGDLGNQGG